MNTRSKVSSNNSTTIITTTITNNGRESSSSSKIGYKGSRYNVTDRKIRYTAGRMARKTKQILEEDDDILIYHGLKRKAEREEEHINEVKDYYEEARERKKMRTDNCKKMCICEQSEENYGGEDMICCEICLDWFHPECVGVSDEYCNDPNTFYVCRECRQLQVPCASPDCRISKTFKAPAYWSTDLGEEFKVIKDECAKMTRCKKCDILQ
ncbi:5690_t:CDS:2, partial [Funneliformis geosporum]